MGVPDGTRWPRLGYEFFSALFFGARPLSMKTLIAPIVATMLLPDLLFFWENQFVLIGKVVTNRFQTSDVVWTVFHIMDLRVWLNLQLLLLLFQIPGQHLSFFKTRWLLKLSAHHETPLFMLLMFAVDVALTVLINTVVMNIVMAPFRLCPPNMIAHPICRTFEPYNAFLADNHWLSEYDVPRVVAQFVPTSWFLIVIPSALLQYSYLKGSSYGGKVYRYLNKERVEKEPLCLIGEFIAIIGFVTICAYGLILGTPNSGATK